jgi:hypothetical protein
LAIANIVSDSKALCFHFSVLWRVSPRAGRLLKGQKKLLVILLRGEAVLWVYCAAQDLD